MAPSLANAQSVSLPIGFSETVIATDIQNPVGMEISPDGRVFILAGNTRRIEIFDDSGFLNEFISLPQALNLGSGLVGFTFAPDFDTSSNVYIAYLTDPNEITGPQRFRLSRFSSDGTVADTESEAIIFEVEDINLNQSLHQGGDLVIGDDGMIYWALGDRQVLPVVSQNMDTLFGKVLRINTDGTIPADNPFYADLEGDFRAIYANGLRNPFRMDKRLITGEIFMSEVGPQDWEELNRVAAGANYGWPLVSGVVNNPLYTDPAHAYSHNPDGCAIMGGTFYEPVVSQFPTEYHNKYFYADHCFGWIAYVDLDTGTDIRFLTGANRLVEIKVNPVTGSLYYLDRKYGGDDSGRTGGVGRIDYTGETIPLEITHQPSSVNAAIGEDVNFNVLVTGEFPFSYQWFQNGEPIEGESASSLALTSVQQVDNLADFTVQVSDANGSIEVSDIATLTVFANNAPTVSITQPDSDTLYIAGEQYTFSGTATDIEDGDLDASAFNWEIVFHHDEHTHPFIPEILGVKEGTFIPSVNDETSPNVWYRIHLTVTDSAGTATSVQHDVFPLVSNVSIQTNPLGLDVLLDGTPVNTPLDFQGVAGVVRAIEAPEFQLVNELTNTFSAWSNGGDRGQTISTPLFDTTYQATYEVQNAAIEIGSVPVDYDKVVAKRWTRINFVPSSTGIHTIRAVWENDEADIQFSVFQILNNAPPNNSIKIGTTSNSNTPGEWTGALDASEQYYLGVWATSGSANVTMTIEAEPVSMEPLEIIAQPADQIVIEGNTATFTVDVIGTGTIFYQWSLNGVDISEANDSTLTIEEATPADAGAYMVRVNDDEAVIDSLNATLTITEPPVFATIGQGILDADKIAGPRWLRINFEPLGTEVHTITMSWDSDADVRFKVREADGTLIPPTDTVRGTNPGLWQGELEADKQYFVGVWSTRGIANYVATIKLGSTIAD